MFKQLDLFGPPSEKQEQKPEENAVQTIVEDAAAINQEYTEFGIDPVAQPEEDLIQPEVTIETTAPENSSIPVADTPVYHIYKPLHIIEEQEAAPVLQKEIKMPLRPVKSGKRGRKSLKEMESETAFIAIPEDDILFQKQYYSIGDVAEMFGLNTSLLRYWETEFDILKPRKNRKGDRHFRPEDIKNLNLIHHLLRQRKYTIEGAKAYLKKNKSKAQQNFELIQRMEKLRGFLLELKAGL